MSYEAALMQLVNELNEVEKSVIEEIIDYAKGNPRVTQKSISEQFNVELNHVKAIKKFSKKHSFVPDFSRNDLDTSSQSSGAQPKEVFLSVDEMSQHFLAIGSDDNAVDVANPKESLLEKMLIDAGDDSQELLTNEMNDINFAVEEDISEGEKLIKHVKWFVSGVTDEIASLREDAKLFDAERNGHKEKQHQLTSSLRKKDHEIAKLKAELVVANQMHKNNVCICCNNPQKFTVGDVRFCGFECIKKTSKNLRGAEKLPQPDS